MSRPSDALVVRSRPGHMEIEAYSGGLRQMNPLRTGLGFAAQLAAFLATLFVGIAVCMAVGFAIMAFVHPTVGAVAAFILVLALLGWMAWPSPLIIRLLPGELQIGRYSFPLSEIDKASYSHEVGRTRSGTQIDHHLLDLELSDRASLRWKMAHSAEDVQWVARAITTFADAAKRSRTGTVPEAIEQLRGQVDR